jgi:hypothetical protein
MWKALKDRLKGMVMGRSKIPASLLERKSNGMGKFLKHE